MAEIIQYSGYPVFLNATLDSYGHVSIRQINVSTGFLRGNMAYIATGAEDPYIEYDRVVRSVCVTPGCTVFVSPDSKISRDLIRQSGYRIVRDKDKADKIIVPQLYKSKRIVEHLSIFDEGKQELVFVTVRRASDYITASYNDFEKEQIIEMAKTWMYKNGSSCQLRVIAKDDFASTAVYFIKRSEELKEVLSGNANILKYVSDVSFPLTASNVLNPEKIEMLYRYEDTYMFQKILVSSDWQKYPFTVNMLLSLKRGFWPQRSDQMNFMLRAIDYDNFSYRSPENWGKNRLISAEDWNLAQRFIMFHIGLDQENGGFVDNPSLIESNGLNKYVRKRLAYKPYFITEPMPFEFLMEMAKNS